MRLNGWVHARRNMGKIVFLDLCDRWGIVQIICVPSELDKESQAMLKDIWPEFWGKIEKKLGNNNDFKNYVPPHKNLGVMFLKTYHQELQK